MDTIEIKLGIMSALIQEFVPEEQQGTFYEALNEVMNEVFEETANDCGCV